ncbi:GTP-binding protein ryh1 [Tritrichomonas foetus]|uniref:GTP-binding protein ryh1 n=1 Tax=Tritrichomonas foetus TaxID=1144522 RepID=A0A1J4JVC0_9EUKA|nr:GTP-binding protein ryh1 [Tritrichomonas foetus]|eukprot:OHT01213.1 GTP-binding protein ryh1 [Tritrichomonas foetus]
MSISESTPKPIKVSFIGDTNTGKTSIIFRYLNESFDDEISATFGADAYHITVKDTPIVIFDTVGQERYKSVTKSFLRNCDVVVLVYDVTSQDSFDSLKYWIEVVSEETNYDEKEIIIVGNKIDLYDSVEVEYETSLMFCQTNKIENFIETSAENGQNIDELFEMVADLANNLTSFECKNVRLQDTKNESHCC